MCACACVYMYFASLLLNPIQTGGGGGGGGGAFDATQDLNPLLLRNDCVYSVPTSRVFLKFTWKQYGVVRFW